LPRIGFLLSAISIGALVLALVALLSGRVSLGGDSGLQPGSALGAGSAAPPPRQLFAADSVWNRPLDRDAALDPASSRLVAALGREVGREEQRGVGPWIDTSTCSTPIYVVPRSQPSVRVRLSQPHEWWRVGLAKVFARVPLPDGAQPASCSDAHLTVWQPSRDRLWEFFGLRREGGGWEAEWGGAMRAVSQDPGYYDAGAWPGRSSYAWGATATSLPVAGGVMRLAELRHGRIEHALAMNVPTARRGAFAWPAQRSDGIGSAADLPEGARLRIDPALDLSSLGLPPLTLAIAEAAQRYGILVRDQTGAGNGVSFFGQPGGEGERPYARAGGYFGGMNPTELLADFPWADLQVLKMDLCRTGPCRR
jgi:hypothetical protein